jgi:DNA-directed RNA polymerase subunit RPC12/RpoP
MNGVDYDPEDDEPWELGPEAMMWMGKKDEEERPRKIPKREDKSKCLRCDVKQFLKFDEHTQTPYMRCPKCLGVERF